MTATGLKVGAEEALDGLLAILDRVDGVSMLLCTCLDADGFVGDTECFSSPTQPLSTLPIEYVFFFALARSAAAVLVASRAGEHDDTDLDCLTLRLLAEGAAVGIEVVDHVVVGVDGYERLRETTDLWA